MNNTAHIDPEPWVSRINPQLRAPEPDAFPERIGTHGVDYAPRVLEVRILVTYKGETGYLCSETDINLRTRYGVTFDKRRSTIHRNRARAERVAAKIADRFERVEIEQALSA
ncbi:hypothetical protein FM104_04785 [Microbacterium esteraromaticum]|uniref:Uncharacterized protein n=1 Tax=Microbacterium esteraromaticum TaxID=57043 RepID=A0A1R4IZD4_9MICO|nr:hypothetical protein [Microbacterium esteraromaticum]SJN25222.1 hypothetical protein FM104_04785 [Microbacterium esteraromaticum]